jgi:hypothetical protein
VGTDTLGDGQIPEALFDEQVAVGAALSADEQEEPQFPSARRVRQVLGQVEEGLLEPGGVRDLRHEPVIEVTRAGWYGQGDEHQADECEGSKRHVDPINRPAMWKPPR